MRQKQVSLNLKHSRLSKYKLTTHKNKNVYLWEPLSGSYHIAQIYFPSTNTRSTLLRSTHTVHYLSHTDNDLICHIESLVQGILIVKLSLDLQPIWTMTSSATTEAEKGIELLQNMQSLSLTIEKQEKKVKKVTTIAQDERHLFQLKHALLALCQAFGTWLLERSSHFLEKFLLALQERRTRATKRKEDIFGCLLQTFYNAIDHVHLQISITQMLHTLLHPKGPEVTLIWHQMGGNIFRNQKNQFALMYRSKRRWCRTEILQILQARRLRARR